MGPVVGDNVAGLKNRHIGGPHPATKLHSRNGQGNMKVEGTEDSKIFGAITDATDAKLVFNDDICGVSLSNGQVFVVEPGSFHVHRARGGNDPQTNKTQGGPPFLRFKAIVGEDSNGDPQWLMVEAFLTSLAAVYYPDGAQRDMKGRADGQ